VMDNPELMCAIAMIAGICGAAYAMLVFIYVTIASGGLY